MPALFFILGSVMLFMFIFIAGKTGLGTVKPLLSVAYVGLWLYCMFEAVMIFSTDRRKGKMTVEEVQTEYGRRISGGRKRKRISTQEAYAARIAAYGEVYKR